MKQKILGNLLVATQLVLLLGLTVVLFALVGLGLALRGGSVGRFIPRIGKLKN